MLKVEPRRADGDFARRTGVRWRWRRSADLESRPGLRRGHRRDSLALGGPVAGAAKAARVLRPTKPARAFPPRVSVPARGDGSLRQVYEAGGAGLAVQPQQPVDEVGLRRRISRCSPRSPTGSGGGRVRRSGAVASRLGAVLYPGRVAGSDAHPRCLTQLPSDKLAEVLESVGAAIDAMGGSFTMHYATVAVTAGANQRLLIRLRMLIYTTRPGRNTTQLSPESPSSGRSRWLVPTATRCPTGIPASQLR